jgi:RNA polymerase sigma factor (sigma-70 family)
VADDIHHAIETVFRIERARLLGGLARITHDIGRAEELAQDAMLLALTEWTQAGVPRNPGAWLMTAARRRALDQLRHTRMQARQHAQIGHLQQEAADVPAALDAALDDDLGDELLGLIFAACHPLLSPEARAALTLRLVGGLTTAEIARAFLTAEPTIRQRIVRAKRTLAQAGLRLEVPRGAARAERLGSVLEVIYLIFNEGYAATAGEDLVRPALCAEAQRLGRILAALLPEEPEVLGLRALMELQASRLGARVGPDGALVPLPQQDRARWDRLLIRRGLAALARAQALKHVRPERNRSGRTCSANSRIYSGTIGQTEYGLPEPAVGGGPYTLQAALAACHATAARWEETDWARIAALYDALLAVMPSPVVALNRAIAHGMASGPQAGLALLDELAGEAALAAYAPLPAARADCLLRAGRAVEAGTEFRRAAALSGNARERDFLLQRAQALLDNAPQAGSAPFGSAAGRRAVKKSRSSAAASASRTPPTTSGA